MNYRRWKRNGNKPKNFMYGIATLYDGEAYGYVWHPGHKIPRANLEHYNKGVMAIGNMQITEHVFSNIVLTSRVTKTYNLKPHIVKINRTYDDIEFGKIIYFSNVCNIIKIKSKNI